MKSTRARIPLRLKGTLLALSIAAMATQVSGASAAQEPAGPRLVTAVGAAWSAEPAQPVAPASLLRGPPMSGDWALLVAGLFGVWAIGRRRMAGSGSRNLDLHGSRRGRR